MQGQVWQVPAEQQVSRGRQVLREIGLILLYLWHVLRGPLVPPASALREGDHRPVVLVPGFLGRSESFVALQRKLNTAGHPCYILPLGFQMGDILKKGRELSDLLSRHQLEDVYVIAHSMGGLITIGSLLQGEQRIRHAWCLGSPLFGTVMVPVVFMLSMLVLLAGIPYGYGPWMLAAGIFLIPCLRQMGNESVLLRLYRRRYDEFEQVTSVYALYDEIVLTSPAREPGSSSRFGRSTDVLWPEIGHNNLFMGEAAMDAIVQAVTAHEAGGDVLQQPVAA